MIFNEGDRVYYIKDSYASVGHHNPLKGTDYECQGTVMYQSDKKNGIIWYRVDWDNGKTNTYEEFTLELINNTPPALLQDELFTL